ncbi:L-serine ammonia-lyase, iron-sulfur-dependent, subunit alpha [Bengtsoniella intestinalis]|uniref:L-cysteine desulfidase family protein n=1 Tax=Bengtsoniella intestinalis TaxID=3073143 RepID=UPI00391F332A
MLSNQTIQAYAKILEDELQVAMGCTEPIAVAYAAAYGRELLGCDPERVVAHCSGNIIKNVKAVTVPQTGGLKSIETAVLAGIHGGDASQKLEVIAQLSDENRAQIRKDLDAGIVTVELLVSCHALHFIIELFAGEDMVSVEIVNSHTNFGTVSKNGEILHQGLTSATEGDGEDLSFMKLADIIAFTKEVDVELIRQPLERQIACNTAIAQAGLTESWGARVGQTLMAVGGDSVFNRMKAMAAAGSDARMSGCALPVVINSGSGNQGMTVSLPVISYAQSLGVSHEELLRALCMANLTAIYQKGSIGKLSAFCGVVSAATGAVAGLAYLDKVSYEVTAMAITNSLANIGGMVCDGAKASCAGKIASAVESALLGYELAKQHEGFTSGEGIVGDTVDETIANIGRMASQGMRETDAEILKIMIGQ